MSFWGRWFPKAFWNHWFQGGAADPGLPPSGAATFVLEENVRVAYSWVSGLFKSYSGLERRTNVLDDPAQRFEGDAVLIGNATRAVRSRLARYAATGKPFALGLPYEELPLSAESLGTTVHVDSTALSDWAVYGGRVVARRVTETYPHLKFESVEAVILDVGPTTIELDKALGTVGKLGATIMPTIAVYLDPQQGFPRYRTPDAIERWEIKARSAIAGFAAAAKTAILPLVAPLTTGVIQGLTIRARTPGAAGNIITITQTDDAPVAQGLRSENLTTGAIALKYKAGATTVAQYIALVNGSALVYVDGTGVSANILAAAVNTFVGSLTGGADETPAEVGKGATVAEFLGRPVWDRFIENDSTNLDTMHAFAEAEDLGGLPFVVPETTFSDWGRRIVLDAELGAEWQWAKRFLDAVRARWRTFWLATWRPDLIATAHGVGTLTIQTGEDAGDVFAWYPLQRTCLQIWQLDDTKTYVQIASAIDNHNGTATLQIVDEDGNAVTLSGSAISMVSWLEPVRLEDDTLEVEFVDASFVLAMDGRVVQQLADLDGPAIGPQPRTGIRIQTPVDDILIATGTRPIVIDGLTYPPMAAAHDALEVVVAGEDTAAVITLPLTHPFVVRWLAGGVPPQQTTIEIYTQQLGSIDFELQYTGSPTSMASTGHLAKFRVESKMTIALRRRLPVLTAGRTCAHMLYDANCRVDRAAATTDSTVVNVVGHDVTFSGPSGADGFLEGGEFTHVPTGEVMTITKHVGNVVTLQFAIYGLKALDAIKLAPGCARDVVTCDVKFSNAQNFGNLPQLPVKNPMRSSRFGLGVVEQP